MPKFLEDALERSGRKKGFRGKRLNRYIYGGMNRIGAMRGNQPTAKGARMEAKHKRDVRAGRAQSQRRSRRASRRG